jgi:hypothetical protein
MRTETSPGTSFGAIDAKLIFPDQANNLEIPGGVDVPGSALGTLDRVNRPVGHGELSRRDDRASPLPTRQGFLEIMAADTGKLLYSSVINGSPLESSLTAPVELILAVSGAGLWVRPTVMEAPDGAAVDFNQINSTLKAAHLDVILSPGIYRISLGP